MSEIFVTAILPICICVVLPVLIVFIVGRVRQNGQSIDPELFKTSGPKKKTIKENLLEKLNGACITSLMGVAFLVIYLIQGTNGSFASYLPYAAGAMLAVGIGLFVSYFSGKKLLAKEIEAEEKDLLERK